MVERAPADDEMTELHDAWDELYAAIPRGWIVGRPPFDSGAQRWRLFGYARRGSSRTEIRVEGESELQVVREMTRLMRSRASSTMR